MADTTATKEYLLPDAYTQYLDKLQTNLMSKVDKVQYNPLSPSALKSALSKALRPGYDKAIQNRQSTAATNRAAIDADAAARGVGASTWVTDVKNRQNDAAAKDIAGLESDYSSQLYQNLLSKLSEQDQMSMTAQQTNASLQQNAQAQALATTDKWWEKWKAAQDAPASSGGSSGSSGSSRKRDTGDNDDYKAYLEWLKMQKAAAERKAKVVKTPYTTSKSGGGVYTNKSMNR